MTSDLIKIVLVEIGDLISPHLNELVACVTVLVDGDTGQEDLNKLHGCVLCRAVVLEEMHHLLERRRLADLVRVPLPAVGTHDVLVHFARSSLRTI
jgi:hypothetical protein